MLELVQIEKNGNKFSLNTVFINPSHIVHISEAVTYKEALNEGRMNLDLNPITSFSKITVNEGEKSKVFVVVGDPSVVESKLNKSFDKRKILRG